MYVIAVQNQKGGTGKSTTSVNLAAALAEASLKVLLIDLDQQRSATNCVAGPSDPSELGSFDVVCQKKPLAEHVYQSNIPGVDVLPAHIALAKADQVVILDQKLSLSPYTVLKEALAQIGEGVWDIVIIDCPPALGVLSKNALVAASGVIIPVETQFMSLEGVAEMMKTVEAIQEALNPALRLLGVLACRHQKKALNKEVLNLLKTQFGENVFETVIRENTQVAEAPSFQQSVIEYAKRSPGAADYRLLAQEVLVRTQSGLKQVVNG